MTESVRQAFIGVGANLGDRWATIRGALEALARTSDVLAVESSAIYETTPVGVVDQPKFLNLVAGIETTLTPEQLLSVMHALENAAGRRRSREIRWGPRVLDLDLCFMKGRSGRPGLDPSAPAPVGAGIRPRAPARAARRSGRFDRRFGRNCGRRIAVAETSDAGVERWVP